MVRRRASGLLVMEEFPGLDLRAPLFGKHAIDLQNVSFDENGGVRQRDGMVKWQTPAAFGIIRNLGVHLDGITTSSRVLLNTSTVATALDTTGASVASYTPGTAFGATNQGQRMATYASPGSTRTYFGTNRCWVAFEAGAFTEPVVSTRNAVTGVLTGALAGPAACGFASWQDRLVCGGWGGTGVLGPGGLVSNVDRIYFSEPGDPLIWRDSDYVQLSPGDGEAIQAMVSWRDLLFVFKQTKFFVFHGIQTNPDGSVRFLRREYEGVGIRRAQAVAPAVDGVYFSTWNGAYRTTGGEAEKISKAIDPVYRQGALPLFFNGERMTIDGMDHNVVACGNHVYFGNGSGIGRYYVYDTRYGWWSYWTAMPYLIGVPGIAVVSGTGSADTLAPLWVGDSAGDLHQLTPGRIGNDTVSVADFGSIISFYYGGLHNLANGAIARVRSMLMQGTGEVTVGLREDFQDTTPRVETLILTPQAATEVGEKLARQYQVRARHAGLVLHQPAGSEALQRAWRIQRASLLVSGGRFDEAMEA